MISRMSNSVCCDWVAILCRDIQVLTGAHVNMMVCSRTISGQRSAPTSLLPNPSQALGALSPDEELTPLGRHLTLMPLDPRVGKMLVFGALLHCASPVLTIAAAMGHGRQIFYSPADKRQESQV